ncbi:histone deacetylase [Roseateles sp.]|uniref:histone deacetylase family protein n=1 Tax=Roseateles sp. TaxID=1971397 RepID=UPI00286C71B6|nr:histone deacetylase [Roseateles sp.]
MLAFHSDAHSLALPPQHPFPQSKYRLLREHFEAQPGRLRMQAAPAASAAELALVHRPDYIDAVMQGSLSAVAQREIGFPWSAQMALRSCHSVGASIAAARAALQEGVAANMAGGTHHAFAERGSGYCVFNDVAVAAKLMQAEWGRQHCKPLSVLVIDLDVHQGNGTAAIFRDDPSVFTFSMHGAKNFPARKEVSDLDVELPDGCGDAEYMAALEAALERIWTLQGQTPPDLVFYLAGADPHEGDRLGRLKLTTAGMLARDRLVLDALRTRRIPVALSMAGGYGHDITTTLACQVNTLNAAAQSWWMWRELSPSSMPESRP